MAKSILYILTNEAMPGYVKVGITDKLSKRMSDLDTTSVPLPFKCYYAAKVSDAAKVERLLLSAFADQRVRSNREWLNIAPERIVAALKLHPHDEVTPVDEDVDAETRNAIERATRRSASNFKKLDIQTGAVLTLTRDDTVTCVVQEQNLVDFEGEILSVSAAALKALHSLGYNWTTVNGYQFWEYDGETLMERRTKLDEGA